MDFMDTIDRLQGGGGRLFKTHSVYMFFPRALGAILLQDVGVAFRKSGRAILLWLYTFKDINNTLRFLSFYFFKCTLPKCLDRTIQHIVMCYRIVRILYNRIEYFCCTIRTCDTGIVIMLHKCCIRINILFFFYYNIIIYKTKLP